ncbi:DDE Tnp IS1595 domain-containing protein [Aphis craccivora]|uniref:DDE Tnp IS1595 domain-containing protein n=2 Tax=Aphis craccivora TaxID=307492 RepID=A0A6G0YNX8_APHCR|nr:DDE Tnp IS1595 domain-containing protein [Aphis craccivora]
MVIECLEKKSYTKKWCEQELNLSENKKNYLREVCVMAIENKPQGKIVEIDEIVEITQLSYNR